jgi:hypothetical protein
MSAAPPVTALDMKPVLDLISRELAALQISLEHVRKRLRELDAQLERQRLELVRLSRAVTASQRTLRA